MPLSPSSKQSATSIPSITMLRQELDYGDGHLPRCSAFNDDVRAFRKKFMTSQGLPGLNLYDWKNREHQAGLVEMTQAYLDRDGNGPLFWPSNESHQNHNKLQYSLHQQRIQRLVKQLFFRLNQQQYRNKKYKNKDRVSSTDPDTSAGRTVEDPIHVDLDALAGSGELSPTPLSTSERHVPDAGVSAQAPSPIGQIHVQQRDSSRPKDGYDILYDDVPGSSKPPGPSQHPGFDTPSRTKRAYTRATPAQGGRPSKRQKQKPKPSAVTGRGRAKKRSVDTRTSPRNLRKTNYNLNEPVSWDHTPSPVLAPELEGSPDGNDNGQQRPSPKVGHKGDGFITFVGNPPVAIAGRPADASKSDPLPPPDGEPATGMACSDKTFVPGTPDSSQPHFTKLPTPATIISDATDDNRIRSETAAPSKPAAQNRPRIEIMYWLILQRQPVYSVQQLTPSRKLDDTNFHDFVEELGLKGEFKSIMFTVESPGIRFVQEIKLEDELSFDGLKRQIKKLIRNQLATRNTTDELLVLDMEIEPLRGDSAQSTELYDGDDIKI